MKILLTGINGQLGRELQATLPSVGEVIGVGRTEMDLAQPESILQVINEVKPDWIVNPAAYTAVDKAETETEQAVAINTTAPATMAQVAQRLNIPLLHVSTDYVFSGDKNTPYTEDDVPSPLGVYGSSKLAGEEKVRQNCDRSIVLRTAWVYSAYGKGNFVKTMLRLGAQREELRVVADQVGTPTWARDIAEAMTALITKEPQPSGQIYHFTNSGVASWYDLAVATFEEAQALGHPLAVKQVVPITTPEYPTTASRPAYSVLSQKKLAGVLGTYAPHWRQSLRKMLTQYLQQ
ncbi:MAG: dTDP-4-dehydrorhamnose reductase [Cyanophyceae cyanobacterium]